MRLIAWIYNNSMMTRRSVWSLKILRIIDSGWESNRLSLSVWVLVNCKSLILLLSRNIIEWSNRSTTINSLLIYVSILWYIGYYVRGNILISFKYALELSSDESIVWDVFILERLKMMKNGFDFWYIFSSNPKLFFWVINALCFNMFDLVHGVFFLFSPLKFLIQEIKDNKI